MVKKIAFFFLMTLLAVGCAPVHKTIDKNLYKSVYLNSKLYERNFNNMYVILDASSSMGKAYTKKTTRFMVAKMVAGGLNNTLPMDMGFGSALRTFGRQSLFDWNSTKLHYLSPVHSRKKFNLALDAIKGTGGTSDLAAAILGLRKDIKSLPGTTALVIISDGEYIEKAIPALKLLKKEMGPDLCVYTIFVGTSKFGQREINNVAKAGICGFSRTMDNFNVGDFIKSVFLKPAGDADKDGVLNPSDQCPNTPIGAKVDEKGCWVIKLTLFDFDNDKVKPEFYPILNDVALVMSVNRELDLKLEGRADSVGAAEYNLELSKRRAEAVKKYLVEAGIGAHRIIIDPLGESSPLAPNDTDAGRQKNRSVESIIVHH